MKKTPDYTYADEKTELLVAVLCRLQNRRRCRESESVLHAIAGFNCAKAESIASNICDVMHDAVASRLRPPTAALAA